MNTTAKFTACIAAAALLGLAAAAQGDVSVSLNISGDIDDIIAVLQALKEMGVASVPDDESGEPALRLQMHSVHETGGGSAPPDVVEPEPVLALRIPTASPNPVRPGGELHVSVHVIDAEYEIDTISASLGEGVMGADLRDYGMDGDRKAGDGIWTARIKLPEDLSPGRHAITMTAYGAYGNVLSVESEGRRLALTAKAWATVIAPPEAARAPERLQTGRIGEDPAASVEHLEARRTSTAK